MTTSWLAQTVVQRGADVLAVPSVDIVSYFEHRIQELEWECRNQEKLHRQLRNE